MGLVLIALVSALVLYFLSSWLYFRLKYDLHKIPSPPSLPVVGHLMDFLKMPRLNYNSWALDWSRKLGNPKVMKRLLPGEVSLFIFDVEYVKTHVLGRDGLPKSRRFYHPINSPLCGDPNRNVLFTTPYLTPYFRQVRRAAASAFSSANLRVTLPRLQEVITNAMARIDKERAQGPVNLQSLLVHMTMDVIGKVGFEQDFGGLDQTGKIYNLLKEAFMHFEDYFFKPHLQLYMRLFPNSKPAIKKRMNDEGLVMEWTKIVDGFMQREPPNEQENSLWANLRKLIDPDTGKPVEADKLIGDVATLVIAGMDTTGHQLGWILAILSDHPETVDKILDELKEHNLCGPDAKELVFENLADLKFLNAVIKECMRILTSTVIIGVREAVEDMNILGYRVPKGTQICVPSNVYPHMEEHYDDPESFKPDRWLHEKSGDNLYLPFSYGVRDCVGQRLGFFEMQVTLIRFLMKYRIKLTEGSFDEVRANRAYDAMVVSAEGGLFFDVTDRSFETEA
eukprot:g4218.t1